MVVYERSVDDKIPRDLRRLSVMELVGHEITELASKNPNAIETMLRFCELMKLDRHFEGYIIKGAGNSAEQLRGGFSHSGFMPEQSFLSRVMSFRDRQTPPAMQAVDNFIASEGVKEQLYPLLELIRTIMGEKLPSETKKPEWHERPELMAVKGKIYTALKQSPYAIIKR
ncbi:MAG: hypothetical protein KGH59_04200 [Candidatus Micrarchaeota archaeon]|nr:hypothetical protein [Candidatus Micrarchaeota archaeon]MDE1804954.1 hypothetical protein [Candidatus Micrarchaeota archaeon]